MTKMERKEHTYSMQHQAVNVQAVTSYSISSSVPSVCVPDSSQLLGSTNRSTVQRDLSPLRYHPQNFEFATSLLDAAERLAKQQQDLEDEQATSSNAGHLLYSHLPSTYADSLMLEEHCTGSSSNNCHLTPIDSMPCLLSEFQHKQEFFTDDVIKKECLEALNADEVDEKDWITMKCRPFNMRVVNLNNFPITQTLYRTNYRSHSTACVRAKMGSIQNTAKSLDLMRSLIQKSVNKEIDAVIQKHIEDFFNPAIEHIRLNNGENSVSDEHIQTVCRQVLEEAKKMYSSDVRSMSPCDQQSDSVSDTGSQCQFETTRSSRHAQLLFSRKRRISSGSESSSQAIKLHKKKMRGQSQLQTGSGRSTPSRLAKLEPIRREGPQWDPNRLKADTLFVMGSKANKALGLGATRGRLYIKHPDIFKYGGDQDDKQWLHERHYMPATGGRTYLLLVDDIKDLAQTDEYRNSGALQLDEIVGFSVPDWMLEKMRVQMRLMRTDYCRPSKLLLDSTPQFSSQETSLANTPMSFCDQDEDIEEKMSAVSPLNTTGGFSHSELSPATL